MADFHLATINIAHLVAPVHDPRIAGFVAELEAINAIAESSPGFLWRWTPPAGSPSGTPFDDDPAIIVNLSVWTDPQSLRDYTYRSRHVEIYRQRAQWFHKMPEATYCLWWVPAGHIPTTQEGYDRLMHYRAHGATDHSFWFSQLFPAPALAAV